MLRERPEPPNEKLLQPTDVYTLTFNPNRSLDRYIADCYEGNNFLSSFIFLLASCFSFVLDVARCAFKLTTNHLLNNQIKSIQDPMTDLDLMQTPMLLRNVRHP